jgi:hypothetical protein
MADVDRATLPSVDEAKKLQRERPHSLAASTRTHLTFSARAHFLKSGGKLYEIPPQSRYSRFA